MNPKTKEEMPYRYRRNTCKFCGARRQLYQASCLRCKDKLPKYDSRDKYRKEGYSLALQEIEQEIDNMEKGKRIGKYTYSFYTIEELRKFLRSKEKDE